MLGAKLGYQNLRQTTLIYDGLRGHKMHHKHHSTVCASKTFKSCTTGDVGLWGHKNRGVVILWYSDFEQRPSKNTSSFQHGMWGQEAIKIWWNRSFLIFCGITDFEQRPNVLFNKGCGVTRPLKSGFVILWNSDLSRDPVKTWVLFQHWMWGHKATKTHFLLSCTTPTWALTQQKHEVLWIGTCPVGTIANQTAKNNSTSQWHHASCERIEHLNKAHHI